MTHISKSPQKIGLVFSGGGSRGAYQIGLWKALRELGWEDRIEIVTGTSVGAINGASFIQGDYERTYRIWHDMEYHHIFDALSGESQAEQAWSRWRRLAAATKDFFTQGGIRVNPLKKMVHTLVKEEEIRKKSIDFGLVSFNLSRFKGERMMLEDIPEGMLTEHIIASATFPIFQPHTIGTHKYLDGGFISNIPVNFMRRQRQDLDLIILSTISYFPHKLLHRREPFGIPVLEMTPSKNIGFPWEFHYKTTRKGIQIGYEDAMRKLSPLG